MLLVSSLCVPSLSLSFNYSQLGTNVQQSLIAKGNASIQPTYVELTVVNYNDPQDSAGRLYSSEELFLWDGASGEAASFNCSFEFRIDKNPSGGDGLTFLLGPNSSDPPDNAKGAWLGLFNSSNNGSASNQIVAVEFDTYDNPTFLDPNGNHIGVDVNNIISNLSVSNLDFGLANSKSVYAWVDYSSSESLLEVYATNLSNTKPGSPLLSYSITLAHYLPQHVYVGFSAATGSAYQNHSVLSWRFESTTIGVAAPPRPDNASTAVLALPPASPANKGSRTGLFVGLGAGLFIILTLLALLGLFIASRRRRRFDQSQFDIPSGLDLSGLPSPCPSYGPRKFTYRELSSATNNFSQAQLLGGGGFGPVYKGVLSEDGSEVAVKCIAQKSAQGEKEFFAEVTIISRIRHRHLVQLKGWCREKANLLLVYEFLPNGSLDHHLFDKAAASTLDWSTRYRIVCGLGSALQYLHEECEKVIVHRDIKASNVMLDSNFNAKLGDFGLARQLGEGVQGHTTLVAGTVGYMAPECYGTGRATAESDVYSFGAVLLEVGCGRRPVDGSLAALYEGRLLDWVWGLHAKGEVSEAVDARLKGNFDEEQLRRMLILGLACSHPDPKSRPSVRLALEALQGRVRLPAIPTFKPVAYYGSPPPMSLLTTTSNSSSAPPASSCSSGPDVDLSEKSLLHSA